MICSSLKLIQSHDFLQIYVLMMTSGHVNDPALGPPVAAEAGGNVDSGGSDAGRAAARGQLLLGGLPIVLSKRIWI
jgi:hypothetical protein